MRNNSFKLSSLLAMVLCFGLVGCGGNTSTSNVKQSTNTPTSSSVKESTNTQTSSSSKTSVITSSSVKEKEFTSKVDAKLVEGEDYIDHNATFFDDEYQYDDTLWYVNDLDDVPLPDPQVFAEDGVYYITGTSDATQCKQVEIYYTTDFVEFFKESKAYRPASGGWEADNPLIYAPEIYCFDGNYYLYYSAVSRYDGIRHNSVVVADNPLGPYEAIVNDEVDGFNEPLFAHAGRTALDSSIFVDDDGSMYMYYSEVLDGQVLAGVELNSPYQADWDTYKVLGKAGYIDSDFNKEDAGKLYWEMYHGGPILEAPYMLKSPNGQYYLTYSANGCWNKAYTVCYAVSDDPLGTFVKPYEDGGFWTNILFGYSGDNDAAGTVYNQWSGFASGTGHHSFFNIGDQIMIGYHAHKNRNSNSGFTPRYFGMDYLYFDEEGVPFCNGPTYSLQPLPEDISGYKNIAENAKVRSQNVDNADAVNDNYIVDNYNIDTTPEVTLNGGYSYIELTFDKEYSVGGIAIYNSAFYDKRIEDVVYVDFGNGNAVKYPEICYEKHLNYEYEFVFAGSGITLEFPENIKAKSVTLCFNVENPAAINEIKVLGK